MPQVTLSDLDSRLEAKKAAVMAALLAEGATSPGLSDAAPDAPPEPTLQTAAVADIEEPPGLVTVRECYVHPGGGLAYRSIGATVDGEIATPWPPIDPAAATRKQPLRKGSGRNTWQPV